MLTFFLDSLNDSQQSADVFPVLVSLSLSLSEGGKRRPEIRLRFAGYLNGGVPRRFIHYN